ncbi:MAG: hypothetical protein VX277_01195 [Candidatus Thermoplasmatota archaeon]|nr:hypothetical protein [Candidatus Thermoplasmatota archaeon]
MDKELNQLTLMGRTETLGKKYPIYLERFGLIFSIIISISLIILISNNLELSKGYNILFGICLAPLFALSLAEIIGRIIQYFNN